MSFKTFSKKADADDACKNTGKSKETITVDKHCADTSKSESNKSSK